MTDRPARLSVAARDAIHRHLATQDKVTAVPISKILGIVRNDFPDLHATDDELLDHIVLEATNHGLAVDFDKKPS